MECRYTSKKQLKLVALSIKHQDDLYASTTERIKRQSLNNDYVIISEGNIITDPAYLSCTSDLDNVINHVDGTHIACLKIKIEAPLPHINVHKRLPNQNDEGEFILPRGSRLLLTGTTHYQGINGIQQFLYDERSLLGVNALMELYHINEITTYELTYLE